MKSVIPGLPILGLPTSVLERHGDRRNDRNEKNEKENERHGGGHK